LNHQPPFEEFRLELGDAKPEVLDQQLLFLQVILVYRVYLEALYAMLD
jgi:hypothetical protein